MNRAPGSFCPLILRVETEAGSVFSIRMEIGVHMSRILLLLTLASVASPGVAQKVRVDYDHACNFSRYKTYRWVDLQHTQFPDMPFANQLMQERIVGFVEEALAAKRFTRVETGADLVVSYDMRVTAQPQFTTYTDATGPGWGLGGWGCCGWGAGWYSGFSTTTTQNVLLGTLVVSMTDSRQKQLVFQGVSTDAVSSKAEKNAKRLQRGVNEMFEKYPPKK